MTEPNNNDVTGHLLDEAPIDFFADIGAEASQDSLQRLTDLCATASGFAKEVDRLTIELAEEQEKYKAIVRVALPELMAELNMLEFKLADGSVCSILPKVNASISEANKPQAYQWLEENNFDGIIKTKVVALFSKGEMEDAKKAQSLLLNNGIGADLDRSVHPATLLSFVKEQLAAGSELPPSIGVFEFKEAKIKAPVVKKKK